MSNWYRHAKVCFAKNVNKFKGSQPGIHSYFSVSTSKTDAYSSSESSSISKKVLDSPINLSIDLTDCHGKSSDKIVADKNSTSPGPDHCGNEQVF